MFYPIFVNPKSGEVSLSKSKDFSVEALRTWSKEYAAKNLQLLVGKKVNRGKDF